MSSPDPLSETPASASIRRSTTPILDPAEDDSAPEHTQDIPDSSQPTPEKEAEPTPPGGPSGDPSPESKPDPADADTANQASEDDEALCRICFGGRDDEDASLGRFIQPCLCRGSMAYIHVGCLQKWRKMSSLRSFYQCDQCGYRYKLRRAKVAGLAENKMVLGCVTIFVFSLLVILAGFAADWLLEGQAVRNMASEDGWTYSFGSLSYDSTGKFVGEAVGEAVRVLNSKLPLDLDHSAQPKPSTNHKTDKEIVLESISDSQDMPNTYRYVNTNRLSGVNANSQDSGLPATDQSRSKSFVSPESNSQNQTPLNIVRALRARLALYIEDFAISIVARLKKLIKHSILGLAFIGVLSFLQLVMSLTFISPFNFGLRHSVLRMIRNNNGRPGGRDATAPGSIVILLFLLVGLAVAIRSVWRFVRRCSQWALRKVEDSVLDVS